MGCGAENAKFCPIPAWPCLDNLKFRSAHFGKANAGTQSRLRQVMIVFESETSSVRFFDGFAPSRTLID